MNLPKTRQSLFISAMLISIFFLSCKEKAKPVKQYNLKTTLELLNELDSMYTLNGEYLRYMNPLEMDSIQWYHMTQGLETLKETRQARINFLKRISEPDLATKLDSNSTVYRLKWVRPFDPDVVFIRINNDNKVITLTTKVFNWKTDALDDKPIPFDLKVKTLTMDDWWKFSDLIRESGFWNTLQSTWYNSDASCFDGASWDLEGAAPAYLSQKRHNYHFVKRHCFPENDYLEACKFLIELTGQDFGKIY